MQIEIAANPTEPNKTKGDLLEKLAKEILEIQNFKILEQVRNTGAELDLLATHKVNGRQIYVECKAYRATLSSNAFFNLKGKTDFNNYSEGWLISAGPLGKDANGVVAQWEAKPQSERERLSIYTAERIIESLKSARMIEMPSQSAHQDLCLPGEAAVDWTLLLSEFGRFWIAPVMQSGLAVGVRALTAYRCEKVTDEKLLHQLNELDSSFRALDFLIEAKKLSNLIIATQKSAMVVEVSQSESWRDYRPSRPEDFVGRKTEQDRIFRLLQDVSGDTTSVRAFALTGDTGMGKSSMIAKLRDRSRNVRHRKRILVYAVDCRAAIDASYITASLLNGLRCAAREGFGAIEPDEIQIDDPSNPLKSKSVVRFLDSLNTKQCICIVFDQFEELYAKPELFQVFVEAKKLLLSAASARVAIVIGFAWRSDATIPLDHPAYHFWHQLRDQRLEIPLRPLEPSEVSKAITIFEKEVAGKLRPEVRQQVLENSQGYPWLLKEICINLQDQVERGAVLPEAIETLDVQDLFEEKVRPLQAAEVSCLKHVAKTSPADWTAILDLYGQATVQGLQEKKLLMRKGDRAVVYWDVFREFLNSGVPPQVPISYIPSVSMSSMISVGCALRKSKTSQYSELAELVSLSEGTIDNVVRDLRMFGIATGIRSMPRLSNSLEEGSPIAIVMQIRNVFRRHAICIELLKSGSSTLLTHEEYLSVISNSPSLTRHKAPSINQIGSRFATWLSAAGFMKSRGAKWSCKDYGDIDLSYASRRGRDGSVFNGSAPPHRALEVLEKIQKLGSLSFEEAKQPGYEKALNVLSRFELVVQFENSSWKAVNENRHSMDRDAKASLFHAASEQESVQSAVQFLQDHPDADGIQLAKHVAQKFEENWASGSIVRTGNALKRWADWVLEGKMRKQVPTPLKGQKGRRTLLDELTIQDIKLELAAGKSKASIARSLGIAPITLSRRLMGED